jgi:hypothetical protein
MNPEKTLYIMKIHNYISLLLFSAEAVNLELVNMNKKPTNGRDNNSLPIKKDTEINVSGPYDEYFVPVNEHRKFMRYIFAYNITYILLSSSGTGRENPKIKFNQLFRRRVQSSSLPI